MSLFGFIKNTGSSLTGTISLAGLGLFAPLHAAEGGSQLIFGGAGWMQYGTIVNSTDTVQGRDMNGRSLISSGAQFSLGLNPSEKLSIAAGLGAVAAHSLAASSLQQGGYAPIEVSPYVSNANFKYSFWKEEDAELSVTGGLFSYNYNGDAQNLGMYLLRGPVYPGYVLSGFETKDVLPVSNTLGLQIRHQTGNFRHDLLVTVETEFFPYWDMSPAYIASYDMGGLLRLGAGVNFYHLIPIDSKLTTDKTKIYIDTSTAIPESTVVSFQGTKVMGMASMDIKEIFGGFEALGPEDLKLYGEVALIGLDNDKVHKALYGTYQDRMPVMVGFNLPAFKFLDRLSFEVEMYKAKFKDDLTRYNHYGDPSPFPFGKLDTNYTGDNFKWSLYGSKVIEKHVKISLQVASDHFRPGIFKGYGDNNPASRQAILFNPDEWYWMTKIAYFF